MTEEVSAPAADDAAGAHVLIPPILGLALASASLSLTLFNGHRGGAAASLDFAPMVLSCAGIAALGAWALRTKRIPKQRVALLTFLSIHLAGIAALVLALCGVISATLPVPVTAALEAVTATGNACLSFYWLRKLRATAAREVALAALAAAGCSEVAVFLFGWSDTIAFAAAFVFAFVQFGAVKASRAMQVPSDFFPAASEAYFGTGEKRFSSRGYLAAAALGICFMAVPLGLGTAIPLGEDPAASAPFINFAERAFLLVIIIALVAAGIYRVRQTSGHTLTTLVWLAMELLVSGAMILIAIGGEAALAGRAAMLATSLILQAFAWYLSVAFVSFGTRDPYFYTAVVWVALCLLEAVGGVAGVVLYAAAPTNTALAIAIMGLCVLASAQVVFTQLLSDPSRQVRGAAETENNSLTSTATTPTISADNTPETDNTDDVAAALTEPVQPKDALPLMSMMGVPPENQSALPSAAPQLHIATSVIALGQQFGLTGREIEVLTLYALGHTQARVSEELQLSQNTVHTHIKRIYDKTNLHSRQEILDYLAEYGA